MNFSTLQELTWYLPDHPALYRNDQVDPREVSYQENKEIERFLMAYRQPKFGWYFTRMLHEFGIQMPGTLSQADHVLYRLKSHLLGNREPMIVKAMAMAFAVSEFPVRVGVDHNGFAGAGLRLYGTLDFLQLQTNQIADSPGKA